MTKIKERCFLCGNSFQFGPHAYDRRDISAWGIMVCSTCRSRNMDGIVPGRHPHLLEHLKTHDIEIRYNAKGWIDWPQ